MQDTTLNGKKCMGVGDIDFGKTVIERPRMIDRLPSIHHYDEGTFAADEVYEELEKGVDGKGLEYWLVC